MALDGYESHAGTGKPQAILLKADPALTDRELSRPNRIVPSRLDGAGATR
jgi:hypothetical protein